MRFLYEIKSFPDKVEGYNLIAYTEGTLRLIVGSTAFIDADGILLVEFAVVLKKWLLSIGNGPVDLYYSSMDFDEEPVLALRYNAVADEFLPESVWAKSDPLPISRGEAKSAADAYLAELGEELRTEYGVDIDEVLEKAVSW
ncbi:DUF7878 domain-containing protein [Sorangium sp. So ce1335]|uniref:DUF7878 domain-containing protein n=1 Tax=Sorangium sp. So ce1335 TaxID=3133335 RepID=UPI003F610C44